MSRTHITTHILDTSQGRPAEGVTITLYKQSGDNWAKEGSGVTNSDGRISDIHGDTNLAAGVYKMKFEVEAYFSGLGQETFYPFAEIVFKVQAGEHYHVPLLLNPYGYSTYRGS